MATYRDLNLNRDLIEPVILEYSGGSEITKKDIPTGGFIYSFQTVKKTARIHVYYKNDGTTTLNNDQCKNQLFSDPIVEKILEKCQIKEFKFNQLYFNTINDENFDFLIDYLKSIGGIVESEKKIPTGTQYKIKGKQGEELSIIRYNNNSIHFQGKPSLLFNNIIDVLIDIYPPNEVLDGQLGYYNITTPKAEILSELETLYPKTGAVITPTLKAIISPSIALRRLSFDLSDFSFMAFPVLRGLEGVMKFIFSKYNITITNIDGFNDYFDINHTTRQFKASDITTTAIPCNKTCNALAEM